MENSFGSHAAFVVMLAFLLTGSASATMEIGVPILKMANLSVDLGPDFAFLKSSDNASLMQKDGDKAGIEIKNTLAPNAGSAEVTISPNENSLDMELMDVLVLAMFELGGAEEIANTTVKSSNGRNVTMHDLNITETEFNKGDKMFMAVWDIDSMNYASLTSTLDEETTKRIVETLSIKP